MCHHQSITFVSPIDFFDSSSRANFLSLTLFLTILQLFPGETISGGWVSEGSSLLRSKNIKSPFLKSRSGHFLYKFSNPPFHIERQMAPLLAISLLSEIVVTQSVSHNPFTANFEQRDPKREFRPSSRLVAHTVSIFGQQCSLLHRTY